MNEGVELLLKRMETNPEEFAEKYSRYGDEDGKWAGMIHHIEVRMEIIEVEARKAAKEEDEEEGYLSARLGRPRSRRIKPLPYLTDEEVVTLYDKLMEVQRGNFVKRVMAAVLDVGMENVPEGLMVTSSYNPPMPVGGQ